MIQFVVTGGGLECGERLGNDTFPALVRLLSRFHEHCALVCHSLLPFFCVWIVLVSLFRHVLIGFVILVSILSRLRPCCSREMPAA